MGFETGFSNRYAIAPHKVGDARCVDSRKGTGNSLLERNDLLRTHIGLVRRTTRGVKPVAYLGGGCYLGEGCYWVIPPFGSNGGMAT